MIGSALGGISSNIMSIATANRRAKQVKQQYETQARLAEYNRQIAENQAIEARYQQQDALRQADLATQSAKIKKGQVRDANQALREKQLALMAKSGVTSAGTPILVEEDQLAEMKLKENDVLYEGALISRDKKLQARQRGMQANYFDSQARMAQYQADVSRSIGKYRTDMIQFQKKLTIAKMFYDGANVTSLGEVDDPQQFQHFDTGTLGSIGKMGGGGSSMAMSSGSNAGSSLGANAGSSGGGSAIAGASNIFQ